ncbi:hypothetical protein BJX64DRAFT_293286 [Aspergillus heterothallicus]
MVRTRGQQLTEGVKISLEKLIHKLLQFFRRLNPSELDPQTKNLILELEACKDPKRRKELMRRLGSARFYEEDIPEWLTPWQCADPIATDTQSPPSSSESMEIEMVMVTGMITEHAGRPLENLQAPAPALPHSEPHLDSTSSGLHEGMMMPMHPAIHPVPLRTTRAEPAATSSHALEVSSHPRSGSLPHLRDAGTRHSTGMPTRNNPRTSPVFPAPAHHAGENLTPREQEERKPALSRKRAIPELRDQANPRTTQPDPRVLGSSYAVARRECERASADVAGPSGRRLSELPMSLRAGVARRRT